MYGNGKQTRSFQYVSDLVDGLVSLMNSNYTQPINIGNPVEHTIEGTLINSTSHRSDIFKHNFLPEFAVIIKELVGGKSKIQTMPAVEDDPQRRKPDITRAKTYLKWEPRVTYNKNLINQIINQKMSHNTGSTETRPRTNN